MIIGADTYTARSFQPYTNIDGVVTRASPTTWKVWGSLQPLKPKELEMLDGGLASTAEFKFYTRDSMHVGGAKDDVPSDQIQYGGVWYAVQKQADWSNAWWLTHKKYILVKPQTQGEPD